MTLANGKAAQAAVAVFGFLTFGCTCLAYAAEAGTKITAIVISAPNIIEMDFDAKTICQNGQCRKIDRPVIEKRMTCSKTENGHIGACAERSMDSPVSPAQVSSAQRR